MGSARTTRGSAVLLAAALLLAACSCDDSGGGAQPEDTTSTTSATPTTTAAEPAPDVVLKDAFDDDTNGWIGSPDKFKGQGVQPAIDRALTFRGVEAGAALDMWPSALDDQADTLADQRVEATVSFTSPGVAHVLCRLDPVGGSTFYVATIASGGYYQLEKVVKGALQDEWVSNPAEFKEQFDDNVRATDATLTPAFAPGTDDLHDVALECVGGEGGTTVTLFDGGDEVLRFEDSDRPILTGLGGLGATDSGFQVARDGFETYGVVAADFVLTDLATGN